MVGDVDVRARACPDAGTELVDRFTLERGRWHASIFPRISVGTTSFPLTGSTEEDRRRCGSCPPERVPWRPSSLHAAEGSQRPGKRGKADLPTSPGPRPA